MDTPQVLNFAMNFLSLVAVLVLIAAVRRFYQMRVDDRQVLQQVINLLLAVQESVRRVDATAAAWQELEGGRLATARAARAAPDPPAVLKEEVRS